MLCDAQGTFMRYSKNTNKTAIQKDQTIMLWTITITLQLQTKGRNHFVFKIRQDNNIWNNSKPKTNSLIFIVTMDKSILFN